MTEDCFDWKGRGGPMSLMVSGSTFLPSTVTTLLANELEITEGESVIDVGCGSGILSIIAAKLGAGDVIAADMSPDVVRVGSHNAAVHGVADKIAFYCGDLFEPLPDVALADLLIGDVSGIPDALADVSGWFPTRKGGGARGCELPVRMLQNAASRLKERGRILLPTGTLQDEAQILDVANSLYQRVVMRTERRIPLPNTLADSPVVADLADSGAISFSAKGSRFFWEARVWELSAPR